MRDDIDEADSAGKERPAEESPARATVLPLPAVLPAVLPAALPAVMPAVMPAVWLLLFGGLIGTFHGFAEAWASALVSTLILLSLLLGLPALVRDSVGGVSADAAAPVSWLERFRAWSVPLGLLAIFGVVVLAHWRSPVPRAGLLACLTLPGWLCLPWGLAACWQNPRARRIGVAAVSMAVGTLAIWGFVDAWLSGADRLAMPLGHHNLLAAFLVTLLPLTVLPWWQGKWGRALAVAAALPTLCAILASRSLTGAIALVAMLALLVLILLRHRVTATGEARDQGGRRLGIPVFGLLLASFLFLFLAFQGDRMASVLAGTDSSVRARVSYMEAALGGFVERPFFGWGPGAARWTSSEHLRPIPGVHPADQVVADPHGLPWLLLYELGLVGVGVIVSAIFLLLSARRRATPADWGMEFTAERRMAVASGLGLASGGVVSLGGLDPAVPAQWLALAVVLGAWLAASPGSKGSRIRHTADGSPKRQGLSPRWRSVSLGLALLWIVSAASSLWPLHRAHFRAEAGDAAGARELDPAFPLYGWQLAVADPAAGPATAEDAMAAAVEARGLSALWLTAGERASGAARERALSRACDLSPFGALAPWRLAIGADIEDPRAPEWAARALIASPWLLAATRWQGRGQLRRQAVELLHGHPGLDPIWRLALLEAAGRVEALDPSARGAEGLRQLGSRVDGEGASSFSLHVFRRQPHERVISRVDLWAALLPEVIDLPAATGLESTSRGIFAPGCRLGGSPP